MSASPTRPFKRLGQHDDESPADYLRRVASNINMETESLLDACPTVEAVLDFHDLWATYDTDFWSGCMEYIAEGEDPEPARAFLRKHGMEKTYLWAEVKEAVRART